MVRRMLASCCPRVLTAAAAAIGLAAGASGAPITPGNVVLYRVGPTTGGLANTGAVVTVDEYTPAGTLVQSFVMPSTGTGAKLIASGTATSEGFLTVSPNGRWVTLTGYNATIPTTGLAGTTSATVNRVVGLLDATTGTTTFTLLSDWASANNPRSAVTDDGSNLWLAGGAGGIRYATAGGTTSTQINTPTALVNLRQVNVFDGQLYATTSSGTGPNTASIGTVGTGLPTVSPAAYATIPGIAPVGTLTGTSRYAFFFADLSAVVPGVDTLYVADDAALALSKYSLVAGSWTLNGTIGVDADDYRGVTGLVSGGNVILHAVRRGGSAAAGGGELVTLTDSSGYNGAFAGTPTILATAATNSAYRGVGRIPGGACCVIGGGCTLVFNAAQCNGNFQGQGTTCSPTPCPAIDGACCLPSGGCVIADSNTCELAGGIFQGVGTPCLTGSCVGACCLDDSTCFISPISQCNGVFQGFGTTCQTVVCPIVVRGGACCLPDGTCIQVPSPIGCNGTYQGDNTVCGTIACPVFGACCTQNQTCVNTTAALCAQNNGTFYPGVPCSQINCDEGACCLPSGSCVITTVPQICVNNGGTFQGFGTTCVPNPCPQPTTGACCKTDGTCTILTPAQCQLSGGIFQGFGSSCAPNPCPQPFVCCFPDGSCTILLPPQQCTSPIVVIGATCVPNPCPQPITGACCLTNGQCIFVTGGITACNGTYLGDGTVCGPDSCKGACCLSSGACVFVIAPECSGTFQGIGSSCTLVLCPQPITGACCQPDGSCSIVTGGITACNGNYLGDGTTCVPNSCPQPVACCSTINIGSCAIRLGNCLPNEIPTGSTCVPNPCPQEGACCLQGGVCGIRTEAQCVNAGGVYQGNGTTCFPNPCPGVCCAGSVCLNLGPNQCANVPFSRFVFTFLTCPGTLTQPCCRADFNHDGVVSVQDIFDFLAQWFATSPLCDINGNNGTTVQDIFDFLAAWFAGCP